MAYDHNMINNYDHLQDSPRGSHMGSKNSEPHLAGGSAGYSVSMGRASESAGKASGGANEHDPGGYTEGRVGSGGKKNLGM